MGIIFRIGFFCSTHDNRLTTNRRIRLQNLTYDNVMKIFLQNLSDFKEILKFCKDTGFSVFRLGSNFIPFFSHPLFKDKWVYEIEDILKREAKFIKSFDIRITMHPGQFVVLNSPKAHVVSNSIRELEYHFFILNSLGLDLNSVVIIHVGGIYGNKEKSIEMFIENVLKNSFLKSRLVVENDDKMYNVNDVMYISENTGLPVVFDYYHHLLNPVNPDYISEIDISKIILSWKERIPKFHISSKGKRKYEHSEYLEDSDFEDFHSLLINKLSANFKEIIIDLMPEAKMKEKASLKLISYINSKQMIK